VRCVVEDLGLSLCINELFIRYVKCCSKYAAADAVQLTVTVAHRNISDISLCVTNGQTPSLTVSWTWRKNIFN